MSESQAPLSDVGDIHKVTVEREAPRIAQTESPHQWTGGVIADEGVIARDPERLVASGSWVDPNHRPEQTGRILPVSEGVIGSSPVAETDVEKAVGAKFEVPPIVIAGRLIDLPALSAQFRRRKSH